MKCTEKIKGANCAQVLAELSHTVQPPENRAVNKLRRVVRGKENVREFLWLTVLMHVPGCVLYQNLIPNIPVLYCARGLPSLSDVTCGPPSSGGIHDHSYLAQYILLYAKPRLANARIGAAHYS